MMPNAQRSMVLDEVKLERYRNLLASTAIFRGCSPQAIDDLVRRIQVRTRPAETIVVAEGEPGDSLFVLAGGKVKVALFGENGRELMLSELKPGDFFGEMSLLDNRPRAANVVALEDTTLLVLSREAFVQHLKTNPQTALNLLAEMTRRLRRADETIANLALHDVESRLTRTLERLAKEEGEQTDQGLLLRRRPTQQ